MKKRNYKLLRIIDARGLTQRELADLANIASEARMSDLINLRKKPTDPELQALCRILNISKDSLGFNKDGQK